VILLDSRPERIDVLRGFAAGAIDYVTKPLDPLKILDRVRETLDPDEIV
jgi:DNA-binding response OmpR family regulator